MNLINSSKVIKSTSIRSDIGYVLFDMDKGAYDKRYGSTQAPTHNYVNRFNMHVSNNTTKPVNFNSNNVTISQSRGMGVSIGPNIGFLGK